jgi:hypothetical protein
MKTIKSAIAFTELLSLGFATIGIRDTLWAVSGQLIEDISLALRQRRKPAARVA